MDRSEDGSTIYGEGMYFKKSLYEKEKKSKHLTGWNQNQD